MKPLSVESAVKTRTRLKVCLHLHDKFCLDFLSLKSQILEALKIECDLFVNYIFLRLYQFSKIDF